MFKESLLFYNFYKICKSNQNNNMSSYNKVQLSPIIVGTMRLGKWGAQYTTNQLETFVNSCIEFGATTFDHADIYGDYTTEEDFGKVLKNNSSLRSKLELVTKCGIRRVCDNRPEHLIKSYDSSANHIIDSVDNSLKTLNTDYIDVLLLHRPDYLMNPSKIAVTMEYLFESGKVRAFGVSNFTSSQFDLINDKIPLYGNQIEVSLVALQAFDDGTLDQCLRHGARPMAWSPFGGGSLFQTSDDPRINRIRSTAEPLLLKYNCTLDQLLLAWLLRHPSGILPVLGTSKIARVNAAMDARSIVLSQADWYALFQASTGQVIP